MYGITETCVHVSHRALEAADASGADSGLSVIGDPLPGLRIHLLDNHLQPVPIGVVGEMYVAGGQLARGYVGKPGLTAGRFVANPFDAAGERLYRSGDTAMWTESGELVYVGRSDQQVKVRGYRIELGEVESAMAGLAAIANAAAAVRQDDTGRTRLIGYLVGREHGRRRTGARRTGSATPRLHGAVDTRRARRAAADGQRKARPRRAARTCRETGTQHRVHGARRDEHGGDAGRPVHRDPRRDSRYRRRLLHDGRRQHRRHPAGQPGQTARAADHPAAGVRQPHPGSTRCRRGGEHSGSRSPPTTRDRTSAKSC